MSLYQNRLKLSTWDCTRSSMSGNIFPQNTNSGIMLGEHVFALEYGQFSPKCWEELTLEGKIFQWVKTLESTSIRLWSNILVSNRYLIHVNLRVCAIWHYDDVIMSAIASQITSLTIVYSTVYPGPDQSQHQSSASLAFVWGIHRGLVNSLHKWPVTRKMFPFDDVIMGWGVFSDFIIAIG